MKKNDIILIALIMLLSLGAITGLRIWQKSNTKEAAVAVVAVDGVIYGSYPLSEDIVEKIELSDGKYNILTISAGYADITEASCPDKICVDHNKIRYLGESIVCLPNKLVVKIVGGEDNGIDASTY